MGTSKFKRWGNPAIHYCPIQGGVEILLVASCCRNWDELQPNGPLGLCEDFDLPYITNSTILLLTVFLRDRPAKICKY